MHFRLDFTEQLNRLAEAFHKYEIDEVKFAKYCPNVKISTPRPRAASCTWRVSPATWPSTTRTGPSPRPSTTSWGHYYFSHANVKSAWSLVLESMFGCNIFTTLVLIFPHISGTSQHPRAATCTRMINISRWSSHCISWTWMLFCLNKGWANFASLTKYFAGYSASLQVRVWLCWPVLRILQEAVQEGQNLWMN